ncbi:MAG: DUF2726 domain-containing protein [Thermochromatium sp.]
MGHLHILLALGGLILLVVLIELARALGRRPPPYVLHSPWLSVSERSLLAVLEHILGADYRLLVRIRASEVLDITSHLGRRARERAFDRLERHRFDILICESETLTPRCALTLAPRRPWRRTPRPGELDRICRSVDLPLVRLIEQPHYSIAEVQSQVLTALSASVRQDRSTPGLKTDLTKSSLWDDDEPRFKIDLDIDLDDP